MFTTIGQVRGDFDGGGRSRFAARFRAKQRAMLHLALSFHTWRTLLHEAGLNPGDAVEAMVQAVDGAK